MRVVTNDLIPVARDLRRLCVLVVATAVAIAAPVAMAQSIQRWEGGATPTLALKDLDGREIRLDSYRGRTVIVNFWATWCAPCIAEMPSLMLLREKYAGRGLDVLGVNAQENAARIRPFLEQHDIDFPVVRDHDASARAAWGVRVYPSSFVIAPDGRIAFVVVGEADWNKPPVETRVRDLLKP